MVAAESAREDPALVCREPQCAQADVHHPLFDSLAEALVKADGKGAIAAPSPSGLSVNDAAQVYCRAFLTEMESGAHARLGDALLAAQEPTPIRVPSPSSCPSTTSSATPA
jgi:hypothetical protein